MASGRCRSRRTGKRRWVAQRWSEAEARQVLDTWQASGLSLGAWCRREGVGYERVRRWRAQLEAAPRHRRKAPVLLPVEVVERESMGEPRDFELELSGGLRLRIPAQFDEGSLVALLRVVEARA